MQVGTSRRSVKVNPHSLRAIRERSGLSVSAFATLCMVRSQTISNIEAGRRQPSPELLDRMARALVVPKLALLTDYDPATGAAA
jgi:transcriptional regulator with XRE-family HTH domain